MPSSRAKTEGHTVLYTQSTPTHTVPYYTKIILKNRMKGVKNGTLERKSACHRFRLHDGR